MKKEPVISTKSLMTNSTAKADPSLGLGFALGAMKSYPGSDGFDYYEFGSVPSGVDPSLTFGLSIRVWLATAKPETHLNFRVRVGAPTRIVNDKPVTVVATWADFTSLGLDDCYTDGASAPGPDTLCKQHRSISGRFDVRREGGYTNEIISDLQESDCLQTLYDTMVSLVSDAVFIPSDQFMSAVARMVRNALAHVPAPGVKDGPKALLTFIPSTKKGTNPATGAVTKPSKAVKTALHGDIGL